MAKKKKSREKNRGARVFAGGAATVVASEIIGNVLGQVLADALEGYLGKGRGKKS